MKQRKIPGSYLFLLLILIAFALMFWRRSHRDNRLGDLPPDDRRCEGLSDAWNHVYKPQRLLVLEACRSATGTVIHVRSEPDGDWHVSVALDPGQDDLLNDENLRRQHGNLVVEVICSHDARQLDAIPACTGWENRLQLHRGQHVRFTGAHVIDQEHGWMELHPVSSVEDLP